MKTAKKVKKFGKEIIFKKQEKNIKLLKQLLSRQLKYCFYNSLVSKNSFLNNL